VVATGCANLTGWGADGEPGLVLDDVAAKGEFILFGFGASMSTANPPLRHYGLERTRKCTELPIG